MFPISFHDSGSNISACSIGLTQKLMRSMKSETDMASRILSKNRYLSAIRCNVIQYGAMWCNAVQCTALYWIHCSNYVYRILTYSVAFNQIRKLTQLVLWSIRLVHCDVTYFMNSIFKLISPNCFEGELFEKSLFWCNAVQCGAMQCNAPKCAENENIPMWCNAVQCSALQCNGEILQNSSNSSDKVFCRIF